VPKHRRAVTMRGNGCTLHVSYRQRGTMTERGASHATSAFHSIVISKTIQSTSVDTAPSNPRLRIFNQAAQVVAENDDWAGTDVSAAASRVGVF
jgi:hypothetical protein